MIAKANLYIYLGLNYLHREMFRSSLLIKVDDIIKVNKELINKLLSNKGYKISFSDLSKYENRKIKYEISDEIVKIVERRYNNLILHADNWELIYVSHLARQISFPDSSNARMGIHIGHCIDLTIQFNNIFKTNKESECYNMLKEYYNLLYKNGLKDARIRQNNVSSLQLIYKILIRFILMIILYSISIPGLLLCSIAIFGFKFFTKRAIKLGVKDNFDEIAMFKCLIIVWFTPTSIMFYSLIIYWIYKSILKTIIFSMFFPIYLWISIIAFEDGTSSFRSLKSLVRLFFLDKKKKNDILFLRKKLVDLLGKIVDKYSVRYNEGLISDKDKSQSRFFKRQKLPWIIRRFFMRIKSDYNEVLRSYDIMNLAKE